MNEKDKDKIIAEYIKEMHPEMLESFEYVGFVLGRSVKKFVEAFSEAMEDCVNGKE